MRWWLRGDRTIMTIWMILSFAEYVATDTLKNDEAAQVIRTITRGFSLFFTVHALWSGVRPASFNSDESPDDDDDDLSDDLDDNTEIFDGAGGIRSLRGVRSEGNAASTDNLDGASDIGNLRDICNGGDTAGLGNLNSNGAGDIKIPGGICGGDINSPSGVDYPDDYSVDYLGVEFSLHPVF